MNVYIVTSGDYSDYHIEGVYSSQEIATESHKGEFNIEEWKMDSGVAEQRQGLSRFHVMMLRDGSIHHIGPYWGDRQRPNDLPPTAYFQFSTQETFLVATFEMWAKDEQHAIKIANERRVNLIATNTWENLMEVR